MGGTWRAYHLFLKTSDEKQNWIRYTGRISPEHITRLAGTEVYSGQFATE